MTSFSLDNNILSGIKNNIKNAHSIKNKEFTVEIISLDKIHRSEKNFYSLTNIDILAEDIKSNTLLHNIVVRKLEDSKYEIVSGERRYLAYKKLLSEGNKFYSEIPCNVLTLSDEDAEILLIEGNAQTRVLSDYEKVKQVEKLTELYKKKKANGEKIQGRIQALVAETLNMSNTAVAKVQNISNNLSPNLREKLDNGSLSIEKANEISSLSNEMQDVVEEIITQKPLSMRETKELKNKLKEIETFTDKEETNKADLLNTIKDKFTKKTRNLIHRKELDLNDNMKKLDNNISKLIKDLDKKTIINLEEGSKLIYELEKHLEELSSKIKDKLS